MAQHLLWILFLCLQTWSEAAGRDTDLLVVNGVLGESVTFPLNIQESQQVSSIAWTAQSSVAFITHAASGAPPLVTVTNKNYYGRVEVAEQSYNLVVRDLRMEDEGDYKADINIETVPHTTTKHYLLHIYRRLGKPKITQSLMALVNNTCTVRLTCSVDKEEKNVTYRWSPLGEESNFLQIFQTPKDQERTYTCTAWNPVSNNSNSVSARQLCAGSGARGRRAALLGALALLLLLLIPAAVMLLRWRRRRQDPYLKTFTKNSDDISSKTIYTYVTVSKTAQPAEPRIYDEIPQSKVLAFKDEPVNTIYSTVQSAEKMGKTSTEDHKPPRTLGSGIVV
uniref:SLAM family member 5 n=1 Tax=Jaculus jaculus TaxID=51337 RepID=UPI001E1B26A5|nr:SLAM family member 5 [Jaculus jaculus]